MAYLTRFPFQDTWIASDFPFRKQCFGQPPGPAPSLARLFAVRRPPFHVLCRPVEVVTGPVGAGPQVTSAHLSPGPLRFL